MQSVAQTSDQDYYTRAANDDCFYGGSSTRTKYTYDNAGNVTQANDNANSANENQFTYDANNRLTAFEWGGTHGGNRYDLNQIGDRTEDISLLNGLQQGPTNVFTNQPGSALSSVNNSGSNVTQTVTSDANQSFTGISPAIPGTAGTKFLYNNAGRLAQVKNASGAVIASYLYDEFGHRIVKTVNGRNLLFAYGQNGELLEESDGSFDSTLKDYYYLQGRLVAFYWAGGGTSGVGMSYSVHNDRLGTPQSVADENNKVVWTADWNPYGDIRTLTSNSGVTLNIGYPGQYFDAETGFIQNGMREYISQWGRYMEEDPLGLAVDENVRAYVSDRPTRYVDPRGEFDVKPIVIISQLVCVILDNCETTIGDTSPPPADNVPQISRPVNIGNTGQEELGEPKDECPPKESGLEGKSPDTMVPDPKKPDPNLPWWLPLPRLPVPIIFPDYQPTMCLFIDDPSCNAA